MKKIVLISISLLAFSFSSNAQVANFDALTFDSTGVWNGSDLSGSYVEEGFQFDNSFNPEWSSWSGFSISSVTDDTTAGWTNQFGVITGQAYSGSNFALATNNAKISFDSRLIDGFYITNSTYAALSMQNGDSFAKKFGGETGDDPDFFKLSIIGKAGEEIKDTLEFYLADYRFEDHTQDYIVTDWTWVDLSELGLVTELSFEFSSSDVGDWGINTPAYFCMDDLKTSSVNLDDLLSDAVSVYPNPAKDFLVTNTNGWMNLYDMTGKLVKREWVESGAPVSVNDLLSGFYFVKIGTTTKKIVKY